MGRMNCKECEHSKEIKDKRIVVVICEKYKKQPDLASLLFIKPIPCEECLAEKEGAE